MISCYGSTWNNTSWKKKGYFQRRVMCNYWHIFRIKMRGQGIFMTFMSLCIIVGCLKSVRPLRSFRSRIHITRFMQEQLTFSSFWKMIWITGWLKKWQLLISSGSCRLIRRYRTSSRAYLFSLRPSLSRDLTRCPQMRWHVALAGLQSQALVPHLCLSLSSKTWCKILNCSILRISKSCVEHSFSLKGAQRLSIRCLCQEFSKSFTRLLVASLCTFCMDTASRDFCLNLFQSC